MFKPLDQAATAQVDAGLKRALVTYATARAIHAGISVAQSATIDVGASFSPGQALTPLAEMVQQFSDVMLVVSVSFGVQKLLISLGGFWVLSAVLVVSAMAWAYFRLCRGGSPLWLSKLFFLLVMVRIAMPLVSIGSEMLFQALLQKDYVTSQKLIDDISKNKKIEPDSVSEPVGASDTDPPGIFSWAKGALKAKAAAGGMLERFQPERLQNDIGKGVEKMVMLIGIFLVHTLVLPLLLLWGFYAVGKTLLTSRPTPHPVSRVSSAG